MIFKDQVRHGSGTLKRGGRCLYRSAEAIYLGSFKNDNDEHWNHMLLIQQIMSGELVSIEEFILTTTSVKDIVWRGVNANPAKEQMQLC